jgi:hypothetical protein
MYSAILKKLLPPMVAVLLALAKMKTKIHLQEILKHYLFYSKMQLQNAKLIAKALELI